MALALLIQLELGMNALDALLYRLQAVTGLPYAGLRTTVDVSYVAVGTLLGGTFGVGTVCSVLLTGTMVSWLTRRMQAGTAVLASKQG